MKFRTDFVTNSSDSSFLAFNIKNKKLFDALTALGIKFKHVENGEFDDQMTIVLPSGRKANIMYEDAFCDCYESVFYHHNSLVEWLMEVIFEAGRNEDEFDDDEDYDDDEDDDEDKLVDDGIYDGFNDELTAILGKAFLPDVDWEVVDALSKIKEIVAEQFGGDETTEEAIVEQSYGFEGTSWIAVARVKDGKRMRLEYSTEEGLKTEDCEGLTFVVTGKLDYFENREAIVEYIEEAGGTVSETVSKNTDYLICNDIDSNSSKMKKAKELGITLLTEATFIRMFGDPEEFEDIKGEDELYDECWEYTYNSGGADFMLENGLSPIVMEVWKDGKWVSPAAESKKK